MNNSSSSESYGKQIKKKKGARNSHLYKHEVIKKAKINGLSHENHVGQAIPSRKTVLNFYSYATTMNQKRGV